MCAETTKVTPLWIFIPFTARIKKKIIIYLIICPLTSVWCRACHTPNRIV